MLHFEVDLFYFLDMVEASRHASTISYNGLHVVFYHLEEMAEELAELGKDMKMPELDSVFARHTELPLSQIPIYLAVGDRSDFQSDAKYTAALLAALAEHGTVLLVQPPLSGAESWDSVVLYCS